MKGNLLPSDYHLSVVVKKNPGGHKFKDNCEVETFVTQDTNLCQQRIEKLLPLFGRFLRCGRYNLCKQWSSGTLMYELLLLELKVKNSKYVYCKLIFWPSLLHMHFCGYFWAIKSWNSLTASGEIHRMSNGVIAVDA